MASGQDGNRRMAVQAVEPHGPSERAELAVKAEIRELVARLRRLAPDEPLDRDATAGRHARTYDVVDVRPTRLRLPEPWPRSVKLAVEFAALAVLLAAVIYGPPYYQCRQMKERGLFFVGETVEACFRQRMAAQDGTLGAFVQGLRAGF